MQGLKVVITGGFGVLGRAVAQAAAAKGARVALVDFAPEAPADLKAALGDGAVFIAGADLSDPARAQAAIGEAAAALGGIDALLNIAGGFVWQTLTDGEPANWERMFRLNLATCANASRAALPHLIASSSGRIVNVGANSAVKAAAGMGAYAASKAGVHKLTESLAEELKGRVTVNAVLPSIIDTPQNRADMPDADPTAWVSPPDLAAVMLFLASPGSSAVTGALVPVTGTL
jgi:NAD(P)-dependent dehydrogenase (short-subunit alcohol dehydrogenase family)